MLSVKYVFGILIKGCDKEKNVIVWQKEEKKNRNHMRVTPTYNLRIEHYAPICITEVLDPTSDKPRIGCLDFVRLMTFFPPPQNKQKHSKNCSTNFIFYQTTMQRTKKNLLYLFTR